MPELAPFVLEGLQSALSFVQNWIQRTQVYQAIAQLANVCWVFFNKQSKINSVFGWLFQQTADAATIQAEWGNPFLNTIESMAHTDANNWDALLHRILPNSLHWLQGWIASNWIVPLNVVVSQNTTAITNDQKAIGVLADWDTDYGNPMYDFLAPSMLLNPKDTAATLAAWNYYFQHPDSFGTWAAPPMDGSLLAYWNDPNHKQSRDALMLIIVRAFQEKPGDVMDALEQWMVTPYG
jgi:hypothetical protein